MDIETITDPNPLPVIPVGGRGDPKALGIHLFERIKEGPVGALIELHAVGPMAVNHGIQAVIHTNTRLAALGRYVLICPAKKVVDRRPPKDGEAAEYGDSHATILTCCMRLCE